MLNDLWTRVLTWSGALVTPDWGALVALLPVLLAMVVAAFVVVTSAKWTSAGPTRRGPGRQLPLAPDGRPLRGPSGAPLAIAAGWFLLAFGLVAGGAWAEIGVAVTVAGLGWWAIDAQRPAPEAPDHGWGETSAGVAGATPPAGTHGPTPRRATPARIAIGVVVLIVAAVLVTTSRVVPDTSGAASLAAIPVAAGVAVGPGAAGASGALVPSVPASLPLADVDLAAQGMAFTSSSLSAPAGRPFTVAFDNRDGLAHNLEIRDTAGSTLFRGDIVVGPAIVVYDVPALAAAQYPFICTLHPTMTGVLTVK